MTAGLLMRTHLPGGTRAPGRHGDADSKQQTSRGPGLASGANTSTTQLHRAKFQQTLTIVSYLEKQNGGVAAD